MNIPKLVLNNLTSRRSRFILTLLGITIGVGSLVTLLSLGGNLRGEIKRQARELGGTLVVTPKGWCAYEQVSVLTGEQLPEAIPLKEVEKIQTIRGITAIPYLTERTAIENNPVPVVGVLPKEMRASRRWEVERGEYFSGSTDEALVIGSGIARNFGLVPGDIVTVRGQDLKVKGILSETGTRDDIAMYIPLTVTQNLYGVEGMVSFAAVQVDDIAKTDEYVMKIEAAANVTVVSDKQLLKSVLSVVGSVNVTLQLIAAIAILAAGFGIANTMMTAVYERKREIGIIQAIGGRRSDIFTIFLLESLLFGFFGGVFGVLIGTAFSYFGAPYVAQNEFTAFMKGSRAGGFDLSIAFYALCFSILVSIASGLYPAYRASRLTPVEAITYE
jgi:putative ABC transport system permease protein